MTVEASWGVHWIETTVISFPGEIILLAHLLALGRFFQILGAFDVASSFEAMGARREARLAVFAEPIFFFTLGSLAIVTRFENPPPGDRNRVVNPQAESSISCPGADRGAQGGRG